jgi:serine/threonine protein kinase/tetratricopeptide (TPR) repeat protein
MTLADHLRSLTDPDRDVLERTIERFEAAWERGEHPSLDAHLPADGDLRNALTVELALADLEYRLRAGEPARAADYLDRYPEIRAAAGAATELLAAEERWRHSISITSSATQFAIPGYDLLDELGRGGMGVVHRARQIAADRIVALKMIRTDAVADPELVARFRTEVEAAARLQHPHIVQIFEVGEHDGRPFFAMEFVTGGSLADRLPAGPLPPTDAAKLMLPLVGAIAAAHARGVIHRDLKPANILLASSNDTTPLTELIPKIADFGLAKRLDQASDQTRTGAVIGTPSYMAPEQADGPARELTAAVDIYSLGATLYACLTGRPPFQAATVFETIEQVRTYDPVALRALQPGVPRDLETICLKCLRKEPDRRYASANDLADDLDRFLGGRPILARPSGPCERSWKWIKRRPAAAAALAVSILALIAVTGIAIDFTVRLKTERDVADVHRERAETSYRLAREAMETGLTKVRDDPRFNRGELEDVRRTMLQAEARFYEQFVQIQGDDPAFQAQRAEAFFKLGLATAALGSKGDAVVHFRAALEIVDRLAAADSGSIILRERRGRYMERLGIELRRTGHLDEARVVLRQAEEVYEALLRDAPDNLRNYDRYVEFVLNRAGADRIAGDLAAARAGHCRVEAMLLPLVRDHPEVVRFRWLLARLYAHRYQCYEGRQRLAEAESDLLKSISLSEGLIRDDPGNETHIFGAGLALSHLGYVMRAAKKPEQSLQSLLRGQSYFDSLVREHPANHAYRQALADCHSSFGLCYVMMKQPIQAEASFRAAIAMKEQIVSAHPGVSDYPRDLGITCRQLGTLLRGSDRGKEALPFADRSVEMLELAARDQASTPGTQHSLFRAYSERAILQKTLHAYANSRRDYDRAIALAGDTASASLYRERADVLARLGEHAVAFAEVERRTAGQEIDGSGDVSLARVAALCCQAARADTSLTTPEREALAERYAARAIQWLVEAKGLGHFRTKASRARLEADPDLEALRSRGDFRQLLP